MKEETTRMERKAPDFKSEAERVAYEEDYCWQQYFQEKAMEEARIQKEIESAFEMHMNTAETETETDVSNDTNTGRKASQRIRRSNTFKKRKQTKRNAVNAGANFKARMDEQKQHDVKSNRHGEKVSTLTPILRAKELIKRSEKLLAN